MEQIRQQAVAELKAHPDGLRYSELFRKLRESPASFNAGTISTAIWNLDIELPKNVWKPFKGFYRHTIYREPISTDKTLLAGNSPGAKGEDTQFFEPFADWLKNEIEDVTQAIPLGGDIFGDRWGTPAVIGKRESRRSDVIKAPTEIVAAEITTNLQQLTTVYGQACAHRLFCHRSYLVVPRVHINSSELVRLDVLCEFSGIGLVTFDHENPGHPSFAMVVRAKTHQPELIYTNRYLSLIERELFS
jgi:hypothetical protein